MRDLCITTILFGKTYQCFIPLYIYSILKAYPRYFPLVFLDHELLPHVAEQLDLLKSLGEFAVVENNTSQWGKISGQPAKCLRWVLWDDIFDEFESIYIGDIDIFIVPESPSLYEQHMKHCQVLQLPYSNIIRRSEVEFDNHPINLAKRLARNGLSYAMATMRSPGQTIHQLSGLHFIKTKEYFAAIKPLFSKYREIIYHADRHNGFVHHKSGFNNECFLYDLIQESGLGLPPVAPYGPSLLDYNNYLEIGFRPHHGIHFGIFRTEEMAKSYHDLVASLLYQRYYAYYKESTASDSLFSKIEQLFDDYLRDLLERMDRHFRG